MCLNLSPIIKQYLKIKKKYPNLLVFYQVGDFYELFFDDAKRISCLLNIVLTEKKFVKQNNVPMAGVPVHSYKKYILKLIKLGESIVICDQINNNIKNNKLIKRKVVKIITPGTVSDDDFLDFDKDNFIVSVWCVKNKFGYSLLDIFSGKFYLSELNNLDELKTELYKTNPSEILYSDKNLNFDFFSNYNSLRVLSLDKFEYKKNLNILLNHFNILNLNCFGISDKNLGIIPAGCLLHYVKCTQLIDLKHIDKIKLINNKNYIFIDYYSIKNLELINSLNNNEKFTLFYVLNSTLTPMGNRLLRRWLLSPLNNIVEINNRHLIMNFIKNKNYKLRFYLKKIGDLERILGRISLKNVNVNDLIKLKEYFKVILYIIKIIKDFNKLKFFIYFVESSVIIKKIISLIKSTIVKNYRKHGYFILKGYSKKFDKLRYFIDSSNKYINDLELREIKKTRIKKLRIKYNKIHGFYIQINKLDYKFVPSNYIKYQSLKNCKRYFLKELKEFEIKLFNVKKEILLLEKKILDKIINYIINYIVECNLVSNLIAKLDVLCCFIERSETLNYTKPIFVNDSILKLYNSRHPILESNSDIDFISNDSFFDTNIRTLLITGPNMGGKSTYMRQIALITIMAYIGCYVPADKCYIGPISKIFTRIGFYDDLSSNKSSFMVEISEISYIINNVNKNSLVLIDEMGRGTSFYEGISLAWSCLNYISKNIQCMTLFSTHFYELIKIGNFYKNIRCFYFDYIKKKNNLIFLYKLKLGYCKNSCGIYIAYKCKLPLSIINSFIFIFNRIDSFIFKDKLNILYNKKYNDIYKIIKKLDLNLSINDIIKNINLIKKKLLIK